MRICFACRSHLSVHFTALLSVGDRLSYETFLSAVYFGVLSLKEIKYFVIFFQHRKTYLKADTWIKGPGKVLSLYKSLSWSDDWVRQLSVSGKAFRWSALEKGNSSVRIEWTTVLSRVVWKTTALFAPTPKNALLMLQLGQEGTFIILSEQAFFACMNIYDGVLLRKFVAN